MMVRQNIHSDRSQHRSGTKNKTWIARKIINISLLSKYFIYLANLQYTQIVGTILGTNKPMKLLQMMDSKFCPFTFTYLPNK